MKLKYIAKTMKPGGYKVKDGVTFKLKGEVLDVDMDVNEFNPGIVDGSKPILEVITEVEVDDEVVEVIEASRPKLKLNTKSRRNSR